VPDLRGDTIGVDIGGTLVKIGRVTPGGDIVERRDLSTSADPEHAIAEIAGVIAGLRAGGNISVGVGCAGLIDRVNGVVETSPNLAGWEGFPLGPRLSAATKATVHVANDANAFGLAEALFGAGRGHRLMVLLTLGTGIGGCVVEDGLMRDGAHGLAAEPGHMSIMMDGLPCPCGGRGCLERYVGGRAIVERARAGVESGATDGALLRWVGARLSDLTPRDVFEAALEEDEFCHRIFADAGRALGFGLVNLVNLLDPDVVILGGGVALAGDILLGPARRVDHEHSMVARRRMPVVRDSALGESGGLIGASLVAREGGSGSR